MVGRLTIYFKQKICFFHMIFGLTSIVLAARLEVARVPLFKLIIWLFLNINEKYNTRKYSFRYAFCLFFKTLNVREYEKLVLFWILRCIAMRFKVGDLFRTVSESLGDFLQKWGIPTIPRPRINTVWAISLLPTILSWLYFQKVKEGCLNLFIEDFELSLIINQFNNFINIYLCSY